MPLTHRRTFRVRHHECNALGYVAPATYLRYMQEAAFDASAAAGYDVARYQEMERTWLIRQTDIAYAQPLRYGDCVEVTTWVADFRRVRSRRAYDLRFAGSRDPVASAETDWAFLETESLRPAAIPAQLVEAFLPEGAPHVAPRAHAPWPAPPPAAFTLHRRVEWSDLDSARHVNNAVHLAYLEDCAVRAGAGSGWPAERVRAVGLWLVPLRQSIEYLQPALLEEEIELVTWMEESSSEKSGSAEPLRFSCTSRRSDGAPVCRARTVVGTLDLQTGQWVSMPDQLLRDLVASPGQARAAWPEKESLR